MGKINLHQNKIIKYILFTIISLVTIVACNACLSFTYDFKLDYFASELYDFKQYYHGTYQYNYVHIDKVDDGSEKSKEILFTDLFENFYYNNIVNESREILNNKIVDKYSNNVTLYTQSAFSIANENFTIDGVEKKNCHYLDYGIFLTYYADDILGTRKYLEPRYGADSFVFISDTYANKLLQKYSISSYEELIKNENYCMLELEVDDKNKIKLSINNIIYADYRHGPRARELYGDCFAITAMFGQLPKVCNVSFEIDLKYNTYGIKRVLNEIGDNGYDFSNSKYSFYRYNYEKKNYEYSEYFSNRFIDIHNGNHDAIIIPIYVAILIAGYLAIYFIFFRKIQNNSGMYFWISLAILTIYSLISNFTFNYSLYSIVIVAITILSLIFNWEEVKKDVKKLVHKIFKVKASRQDQSVDSIEK